MYITSEALPATGTLVPDGLLPDGSHVHELRGQPAVLAFAPDEWNPAQAYQSGIFAQLLHEFVPTAAVGEVATVTWHSLDCRGELAAQLGLAGQRALLLLDEHGVLRWRAVVPPGQAVRPGQLLAALEELRPPAAAPAATGSATTAGVSRRTFLTAALATAALLVVASAGASAAESAATPAPLGPASEPTAGIVPITLTINGQAHRLEVEPRVVLLDALRENLHLTGTKKGCDHGQCGACTVHLDGQSALSCLTLAVMSEGRHITTIEGLAKGDVLHPMQAAFVKHDAFQCGYCTPGQIMAATALVQDRQNRSAAEIREAMSGNLCRCAAYVNIIAAIQEVQNA